MKRLLLAFILISLYSSAYNQIVSGTIMDRKTKEKIIFAAVYFNDTFVGTHSDKDGNFELNVSDYVSRPLTISALGYYSVTLTDLTIGKPLIIYMTPKVFELKEVVVSAKAKEKNLKVFIDNFLGTSRNATRCEILNKQDINITIENDTLKAFASKPIQIINRGLGYKATYYLDKFWFYEKRKAFLISGNMVFNEDLINDQTKKEYYTINREQTYQGSRMHFFRALWNNDLESEGFSLKNIGDEEIKYSQIVVQPDSLKKYLRYKGMLGITDHLRLTTSWVTFLKEYVFFDKRGYFEPFALSWDGAMSKQRIGDILPYEYIVK
jgi:hypothetical protein